MGTAMAALLAAVAARAPTLAGTAAGSALPLPSWSGNQPCGAECGAERPANGFTPLPGPVTHQYVYRATPRHGTYSHGAIPYFHSGTYFVSWAGAPIDEGVQERALCAYSADLTAWSEPVTLFPNVSTAADFDPVQGTNNENFWETPGGSAATPSRLYAFGSIIVDDDPALPRQKGSLIQFLLGRRLEVTDGKLSLGPIFWATDAPPPDLLGYPLHSEVEGDRFARADMALYLGSLLSEFVPGEAQYNHELSERSLYTVPNTSPPQLVQLVRMDSNDTVCPLVTRAATCSACGGNVSKSCMLASTCTLEVDEDARGSDGSGAAEPAADYCRIATGSYHLWPVAGAKRRPRCRWSEGVPSTIPDCPSSKSVSAAPTLASPTFCADQPLCCPKDPARAGCRRARAVGCTWSPTPAPPPAPTARARSPAAASGRIIATRSSSASHETD